MALNGNSNGSSGRGRRWTLLIVIAAAIIVLTAFLSLRPRRIRVQVGHAIRQDITSVITTNGKVEPVQNFDAHSPFATTVKRVAVREGDHVRRGQLLIQLDDADARANVTRSLAQLRAAEANLAALKAGGTREEVLTRKSDLVKAQSERDAAQRNFDAAKRLRDRGAASDAEVGAAQERLNRANADVQLLTQKGSERYGAPDIARAEADVANARAANEAAQRTLSEANVVAPFDGTVYAVLRPGVWVNVGDLLVQVADLHKVQVRAFVDEPEIARLAPGQTVRVSWDAIPGRVWQGTVTSIPTNVVARGTRSVGEFTSLVDNADLKLLPNVNVGVAIVTSSRPNAIAVPREAVHEEDDKRFVYVVNDGKLERREIKVGVANLTHIEVLSGVTEKDELAIASLSPTPLGAGLSVKIVE